MFFQQEIEQLFTGIYVKTLGHSNNIVEKCLSILKRRGLQLWKQLPGALGVCCFFCFFSGFLRARMMPGISDPEVMRDTSCELVSKIFLVALYLQYGLHLFFCERRGFHRCFKGYNLSSFPFFIHRSV